VIRTSILQISEGVPLHSVLNCKSNVALFLYRVVLSGEDEEIAIRYRRVRYR
jgi:hypothetical protein